MENVRWGEWYQRHVITMCLRIRSPHLHSTGTATVALERNRCSELNEALACVDGEAEGAKDEGTKAVRVKACFLTLVVALQAATVSHAQYFERPSSFFLEAGVGFYPFLTYGRATDAALSGSSMSRFQLDLDGRVGWAIARRVYLTAGYDGVLDEIFTNGTWVNEITSGLISAGFRLYPFGPGLTVETDAGVSQLDGFVAVGYGFGATLAWDFSSLGLNAEIGARFVFLI